MVASRIDRLDPGDRLLLRLASVLGQTFDLDVLRSLLERAGERGADARRLARLTEFLVQHGPERYRFRHALFRDSAYDGLPFGQRRELHAAVGELLEDRWQHGDAPISAVLSWHYAYGERWDRTWKHAVAAGDIARAELALVEAADLYRRALRAARSHRTIPRGAVASIAETLGDVLERSARFNEAIESYTKAQRTGPRVPHRLARLQRKQGVVRERLGRYSDALRWYSRGMRVLGEDPTGLNERGELSELYVACAAARFRQGRHGDCTRWALRAAVLAAEAGDVPVLAHAYQLVHLAAVTRDELDREYGALAVELFANIGDLVGEGNALNNLGIEAYYDGRWQEAIQFYERSNQVRARAGDVAGSAMARNNVAEILADQGHWAVAFETLLDVRRVWTAANYTVGVAVATGNLGRTAARRGDIDDGRALLHDALDRFEVIGSEAFAVERLRGRSPVARRSARGCIRGRVGAHPRAPRRDRVAGHPVAGRAGGPRRERLSASSPTQSLRSRRARGTRSHGPIRRQRGVHGDARHEPAAGDQHADTRGLCRGEGDRVVALRQQVDDRGDLVEQEVRRRRTTADSSFLGQQLVESVEERRGDADLAAQGHYLVRCSRSAAIRFAVAKIRSRNATGSSLASVTIPSATTAAR